MNSFQREGDVNKVIKSIDETIQFDLYFKNEKYNNRINNMYLTYLTSHHISDISTKYDIADYSINKIISILNREKLKRTRY